MSKRHLHHKSHSINRINTSVSVDPETPDQYQGPAGFGRSNLEGGFVPSYEDVQRRAYLIHEEKGGSDLENWLEAEQILKEEQHT